MDAVVAEVLFHANVLIKGISAARKAGSTGSTHMIAAVVVADVVFAVVTGTTGAAEAEVMGMLFDT